MCVGLAKRCITRERFVTSLNKRKLNYISTQKTFRSFFRFITFINVQK